MQPITLSLMLQLAASDWRSPSAQASKFPTGGSAGRRAPKDLDTMVPKKKAVRSMRQAIESSKTALYRRYMEILCHEAAARQTDDHLDGASGTTVITKDTAESAQSLLSVLEDVAVAMLSQGCWEMPLGEVLHIFSASGGDWTASCLASAIRSGDVACRVDSMVPSARFSFSHKTIAEYLVASALWTRPQLLPQIQLNFSRKERGVVEWFSDLSRSDDIQRACVCGGVLLQFVRSIAATAHLKSNAMALLAASGYPLDGTNLSDCCITDCYLRGATFEGAILKGTTFSNCDLREASFINADVSLAAFHRCDFGLHFMDCYDASVAAICTVPGFSVWGLTDNSIRIRNDDGKELRKLEGHTHAVTSVCAAPDGHHVVSGSLDRSVRVWDVATGRELRKLEGHTHEVAAVCVTPDGRYVLSGSFDHTIRMWDFVTGRQVRKLEGHAGAILALCLTVDGRHVVSGSFDCTVRMWDVATRLEGFKLEGHTARVAAVCVTPDGRHVVSGSFHLSVRIWDVANGLEVRRLEGHVASVAVTRDGRLVISGSWDHSIRLWDFATGRGVLTLENSGAPVMAVCVSPDGRYLLSGSDIADLYNARAWCIFGDVVEPAPYPFNAVAWPGEPTCVTQHKSHIVSGWLDHTVRVWNDATGREVLELEGHTGAVSAVCVTRDGQHVASGSFDHTIRTWDLATGREVRRLEGHTGALTAVCVTAEDRHVVSGSFDHSVRIWEFATGREVLSLEGHTDAVSAVCVTLDGQHVVSGSFDHTVRVWNIASGHQVLILEGHTGKCVTVCATPDGHIVSSALDGSVRKWDVAIKHGVRVADAHEAILAGALKSERCYAISATEVALFRRAPRSDSSALALRCVSASEDGTVSAWHLRTGRETQKLIGHTGSVTSVCLTVDGRRSISGSEDKTVRIWDVAGREVRKLEGHTDAVSAVCVTPDGSHVVSGSSDRSIRIWEVASGREIRMLEGHTDEVTAVCVTTDGRHVVSGSTDKSIRLWGLADKPIRLWGLTTASCEVRTFNGHRDAVICVCATPDGGEIVSGSCDKSVRIWTLATGEHREILGHINAVSCVCVHGCFVVSASWDRTVRVWNKADGHELRKLEGHTGWVTGLCTTNDQHVVSSSMDRSLRVWSLGTLHSPMPPKMTLRVSRDDQRVKCLLQGPGPEGDHEVGEVRVEFRDGALTINLKTPRCTVIGQSQRCFTAKSAIGGLKPDSDPISQLLFFHR